MMLCVKVLLLSVLVGVSVGQVFEGLGSLYVSAHGPNWNDKSGWMESMDVCQWHGVECAEPSVQKISLPLNNLVGHLEEGFFSKVSTLVKIDFSNNSISGTISSSIGLVKGLTSIDLSSNFLSGTIPREMGKLRDLQYLNLEGNQITGTLPYELAFTPIAILIGNYNQFSGVLPHLICNTGAYFSFTGVTFDCPHPSCCEVFDCGNPCIPRQEETLQLTSRR